MSGRPSFWQRLFGGAESSSLSQRQQKVMRYLIERMDKGDVPLQQTLQEESPLLAEIGDERTLPLSLTNG